MDLSADHVGFTLLAYLISGLALLGLAGAILAQARRLRRNMGASATGHQTTGDR